jgi:phospholipid/cholesterol/gamma-HCH transport system ATP-binding protein
MPPRAGADPAAKLRVENLHKAFAHRPVLDGIDLSVAAGESLVIVGPSGTGKSVLLKHFIGLLKPDSGKVFVDGQDLWALDELERNTLRKKFGMAFQEGALFDSMNVYNNVAFPLRRSGRSPSQVRARVEECLELVQLPDVAGKRPSQLSGGMRRRVGFARAIAHEPEILLFDEPNTGLDPITTDIIAEVILGIRKQLRVTIVTITHHIPSARKIGDRLALLFGGHILFQAPPEEFMKSNNEAVRQFVEGRAEGPLTVEFERGTHKTISEAR